MNQWTSLHSSIILFCVLCSSSTDCLGNVTSMNTKESRAVVCYTHRRGEGNVPCSTAAEETPASRSNQKHCCEESKFLPVGWAMNRKVWGFEKGYRRAQGFGVIATERTPDYFFVKSASCFKVLRWGGELHFCRLLTGMELIDPEK